MQAMRRSDRIRNRIRNDNRRFIQNERVLAITASLPNLLNMGGNGNNVAFDGTDRFEPEVNPNIGDFLPNDQGPIILFDNFPNQTISLRSCIVMSLKFVACIFLITSLVYSIEVWILDKYLTKPSSISAFLSNNYDMANINSDFSLKYTSDRLIKVNKQLKHLKRRLKILSNVLDETINWRTNVTKQLRTIKNEAIKISFDQLEKFNSKIEEALDLYDADKVGITDYALESAGGYIISTPETIPCPSRFSYDFMGIVNIQYPSNPRMIIQPGTLPGQCFAFQGNNGRIRIRLAGVIDITSVTLEHVYPNLVVDTTSAPRDFKVYGLMSDISADKYELGSFTYETKKRQLQTFPIENLHRVKKGYEFIELEILTNHGNPIYTCIYRFRVHGNRI